MVTEDRTKYFGDTKSDRVPLKEEKIESIKNTPKMSVNNPLTLNKRIIDDYDYDDEDKSEASGNGKGSGKIGVFLLIALLLLLIGGGIFYFKDRINLNFNNKTTPKDEKGLTGIVNSEKKSFVSNINGKIIVDNINVGTPVNKDELLLSIDDTEYIKNLENAEKELKSVIIRKSFVKVSSTGVKSVPVTSVKVTGEKTSKGYSKEVLIAEEKFRNDREAYTAGLISKVEYDESLAAIKRAREKEKTNKVPVLSRETKVVNTKVTNTKFVPVENQKVLEDEEVMAAVDKYKKAFVEYERTKIYAPISGIITEKFTNVDQIINEGQELFKITNSDDLWLNVEISEKEAKKVKAGNSVKLLNSTDKKEYDGVVTEIKELKSKNNKSEKLFSVRIIIVKSSLGKDTVIPIGSSMGVKINTKNIVDISKFKMVKDNSKEELEKTYSKNADAKIQEILESIIKK